MNREISGVGAEVAWIVREDVAFTFSVSVRKAGGTDRCLYFPRRQFSVPRCNAHRAERLMGKEMKLKTRSQPRRVIGKVCSNGSL